MVVRKTHQPDLLLLLRIALLAFLSVVSPFRLDLASETCLLGRTIRTQTLEGIRPKEVEVQSRWSGQQEGLP